MKNDGGRLTLNGAGSYTGGTTINGGVLVAGQADALGVTGTIAVNAGATFAVGQGVTFTREVTLNAEATLAGGGVYSIGHTVTFANTRHVGPGLSIGTLTLADEAVFQAGSFLDIELGGALAGEYDHLVAQQALSLEGGTLNVTLYGGFSPAGGEVFDILDWGSLSGAFDAVSLPALASGLLWDDSNLYTTGELLVRAEQAAPEIPEPASAVLLASGAAALALRRRRR